jgi:hypothetical protein
MTSLRAFVELSKLKLYMASTHAMREADSPSF